MNNIEFLNIPLTEWIGYLASVLILISLSVSSMFRLRLINLFGSITFAIYGFMIGSLPVGIMNLIIVFTNIFYLQKLLFQKDKFELIEAKVGQQFVQRFVSHFNDDMGKFAPGFEDQLNENQLVLLVMRNMNIAGVFIANENSKDLDVVVDYVTPQYRDFKNGAFIFDHFRKALQTKKYKTIISYSNVPQQIKYLKRMGFQKDATDLQSHCYKLHLS